MSKSGVKKAFTLIELMIVLAVIAILAIVLIPRAGAARTEAKVIGVSTNVNAVRSFLEVRTGARFINNATELGGAINTAFTGDDALKNPLDNSAKAVIVRQSGEASPGDVAGSVVVIVNGSQYELYGVDNTGSKIGNSVIIKK
ncbi:MAG: type II secretion system protein [Clostridiales bacterium]|uniref:prepilin-type N-terminal cleavage/methylation domain-containing protein n=1 Tax=Clostridium sp. N3C TaxID=1776758 RepID=UPI00092DFE3E|nr:prepilin-type N-terminal cleavage/methylation domain-containing protein [Clostridium sp. N3C]NLZ47936.1 type II secretion system protein [Clostridiales bacterium]SCN22477.1 hypothetical protein N3C_0808 [Clostridium sp. N3C]